MLLLLLLFVAFAAGDRWSVELPKEINPQEFALEHNVKFIKTLFGWSIFETHQGTKNAFFGTRGLHRDKKRRQRKRDPLFPMQWHLHRLQINQVEKTGAGVTIAIVDDGLQTSHPDLAVNVDLSLSYDFNHHKADVNPYRDDGHGTSAAGVCCAAVNDICGRGVAHNAKIAGIKLIAQPAYDYQEAEALTHHNDKIRIYSNSWGPEDSGMHMVEPGPVLKSAFKRMFPRVIYVWAGGNGRTSQDNANYDGYANSPYTLAIGAVDHNGDQSYYSESGACLLAVAPSSGAGSSIVTTDLKGPYGYSRGECTMRFGGTSSSAPLAAGIFALLLEVNPHLTARDIMHIVANVSPQGHTHEKGFGELIIPPLIEAAKTHTLVPPMQKVKSGIIQIRQPIPDDGSWFEKVVHVQHGLQFIEQIAVTVHMIHDCHGQVHVRLGSSILAEHRGDCNGGSSTWTYTTLHEWGKRDKDWTFKIRDDTPDNRHGMIMSVSLTLFGY